MWPLRIILLAALAGVLALMLWRGLWDLELRSAAGTWMGGSERRPVWSWPAALEPEDIKPRLSDSVPEALQADVQPVWVLRWDWMLLELAMLTWPVTLGAGLVYRVFRRQRRDPLLHASLWVGVGLSAGAAGCVALSLLLHDWGPAIPLLLALVGAAAGLLRAAVDFGA